MNQWQMLSRFAREADFDCFLLAGRYTLLDQSAFEELMPLAAERGIAIIAAGVFNSGVLADPEAERSLQLPAGPAGADREGAPGSPPSAPAMVCHLDKVRGWPGGRLLVGVRHQVHDELDPA
jgi:aryl-alcohol dehydrogenase-like predicted oxidoreductase